MRRIHVLGLTLAIAAGSAAPAGAQTVGTLYADGPAGRYLLGGGWLFRLDREDAGVRAGYHRSRAPGGWAPVTVPHAWNAGDESPESMRGTIGWYRREFRLPRAAGHVRWAVRFESANHRARVWLNGRPLGAHTGGYAGFELPADGIRRRGVNVLVVRVDSRRRPSDLPPARTSPQGDPTGGWWNYGGLLREVYLRRIDTVDLERVRVDPRLPCRSCDAVVTISARVRNVLTRPVQVTVKGRFGGRSLTLGTIALAPRAHRAVSTRFRVREPRLWSPAQPHLYTAGVEAFSAGRRVAAHRVRAGVRSLRVSDDGRLVLNGRPTRLRGVGYHEDTRERGAAITAADREWLVDEAKALGATMMRTHYPSHPHLHELADRKGMLLWSEVPVYAVRSRYLARGSVREAAYRALRENIRANWNHPSVAVWSIGNELPAKAGYGQALYIRRARALARRLDPSRPVGLAVAGYPSVGCQDAYHPLDVIGVNEYFGWYPGPGGQLFDRTRLPGYLQAVRDCYADKAVMVTEFGAEANRDGPVEEKGTWLHQQEFVRHHLGVFAGAPWLSGALYWTLNEFRVRPGWDGGNPRPEPPIHQKGLVTYDRVRKPAWYDAREIFRATRQFLPARRAG